MSLHSCKKWCVAFLSTVIFIDFMGMATVVVLFPKLLLGENGIFNEAMTQNHRVMWMGLLLALYPIGQIVGASIFGKLSDYYGRKYLLMLTLMGTFFGFVLSGVAIEINSVYLLFLSRLIAGLCAGNVSIAQASLIDISTEKTKAKNIGFGQMAMGSAYIVGPILGAILSDTTTVPWFNFATPFWAFSLLLTMLIIVTALFYQETLTESKKEKIEVLGSIKQIGKALTDKKLGNTFFVWLVFVSGWWLFESFMPTFLLKNYHFTTVQIGNLLAFNGALYALFQYVVVQRVAKSISPETMVKLSGLFVSLSIISLSITTNTYQLYVAMSIFVMAMGFMIPGLISTISNRASVTDQGQVMGMVSSIQAVSTVVVMLLGGYLNSIDCNFTVVGGGLLILISWVCFLRTHDHRFQADSLAINII